MTLADIEKQDLMRNHLNPEFHGEEVQFTPNGGSARTVRVHVEKDAPELRLVGYDSEQREEIVVLALTDTSASYEDSNGDTVTVSGIDTTHTGDRIVRTAYDSRPYFFRRKLDDNRKPFKVRLVYGRTRKESD